MPRNKDREKNRLENARLKKLSLLPKNKKLKRPSGPEQAKEWLHDVADHLSNLPNARPGYRFVAYAIKRYLQDHETRDLYKELHLVPHNSPAKKGRPKGSLEKDVLIVNMLSEGRPFAEISKELEIPLSRIVRVRTRVNKLLGRRQHGAKPDRWSLEDASAFAAEMPKDMLIAMLSATITAKDILPE